MFAIHEFTWDFVAEGTTVGITIKGYDQFDFVTYCIRPRDVTWFHGLPRAPNAVATFRAGPKTRFTRRPS